MVFAAVCVQCGAPPASAQEQPPIIARTSEGIVLDGRLDERAWASVDPLPMSMYSPIHRGRMTEATEIRLLHDGTYLYAAGEFRDSEPERIRVMSLTRDVTVADDTFGIVIDAFDDNRGALWFFTTPAGIRGDVEVQDDGQRTNRDWNAHWEAAAARSERGWSAEMRIPLSTLGFQSDGGAVRLGVIAYRYISRKNERHIFPEIGPDEAYFRPSSARDTILEDVRVRRRVYVTPYALGGGGFTAALGPGDRYLRSANTVSELGLDFKYQLTPNLTLDLTTNTDFAQVEADDQQVNLTRLPLFFPEKRQFFQERAGTFMVATGGSSRVFHSRSIGLRDGDPTRILGGGRLVGRAGQWDIGALTMQTAGDRDDATENVGVARVSRRVFNPHSFLGVIATTRLDGDGRSNIALALDGTIRVAGDDYLTFQFAGTRDAPFANGAARVASIDRLARIAWSKRRSRGLTYAFSWRHVGDDYHPGLGFIDRVGVNEVFYSLSYFHYPAEGGALIRIDPFQLFGQVVTRHADGSVESAFIEHDFDANWRSGASVGLDAELYFDDLRQPLALPGGTAVPEGQYYYPRFEYDINLPPGQLARLSTGGGFGRFYDGQLSTLWAGPAWNPSPHFGLSLSYVLDAGRFTDRAEEFTSHNVRLRLNAARDRHLSLNGFVQFSNANHLAAANVRLRYNVREGTDFWVVYNEGWNLDRDRLFPPLPQTQARALLIKYTHTMDW